MIDAIFDGLTGGYLFDRLLKLVAPKKNAQYLTTFSGAT
jgi:hypothetical protein